MCPSVLLSSTLSHMLLSVEEKYIKMKLSELCSMYDVGKLDLVVLFTVVVTKYKHCLFLVQYRIHDTHKVLTLYTLALVQLASTSTSIHHTTKPVQ